MAPDVRTGRFSVMLLFLSLTGFGTLCSCFHWNSQPDPILFACKGKPRVVFPWQMTTGNNETVQQVKWIFDSADTSVLVASFSHNLFLTNPDFSKRVRYEPPGILVLRAVKVSDSGNYSIEVTVKDTLTSCLSSHRQSVTLQVGDEVMMEGGQLQAHQDQIAVWQEETQQWFIHLTCGHFTFWGTPPIHVVFTMPSGERHVSKDYQNGDFYLRVKPSLLQDGAYTCEVPAEVLPNMCFIATPFNLGKAMANVTVDDMKTRLSVVESSQKILLEGNRQLKERLTKIERKYDDQLGNDSSFVTGPFQAQLDSLQRAQQTMQDQIEDLKNATQKQDEVALDTFPCTPSSYTTEDSPKRSVDRGDGGMCDMPGRGLSEGWYRFMMNGQDAEIPTSCTKAHRCSTDATGWLDLQGKLVPKLDHTVEVRGCASWDGDCCNWETPIKIHNCGPFYVYHITPFTTCSLSFCLKEKSA